MPTTGVLFAIALAWTTITLDNLGMGEWLRDRLGLYPIDPTGARLILSTIAGSMMTIASLVFSMTVLTLTVASQQMGPRLLEWFMSDRINQLLISYFVSLFVYALLGIGAIGDRIEGEPFERSSAYLVVIVAMVLTVFGIVALIIFVHRTATSIQTDAAIARTAGQLNEGIRNYLTVEPSGQPRRSMPPPRQKQFEIHSEEGGYVQTVDEAALVDLAKKAGGAIRLACAPGHYLLEGSLLGTFDAEECRPGFLREVRTHVVIGSKRTATQDDVIFNLRGVVEIALRALSPGINDPFTAVACIDHLTSALAIGMRRELREPVWLDDDGCPRLLTIQPTFHELMDAALNDIRDFGSDHASVLRRLLQGLCALSRFVATPEQRDSLRRHLDRLRHTIDNNDRHPSQKDELNKLCDEVEAAIMT